MTKKKDYKTIHVITTHTDEEYEMIQELLSKGKQPFLQCGVVRPYDYGCGCFVKIDFGCFFILFLICNHKVLLMWVCF